MLKLLHLKTKQDQMAADPILEQEWLLSVVYHLVYCRIFQKAVITTLGLQKRYEVHVEKVTDHDPWTLDTSTYGEG